MSDDTFLFYIDLRSREVNNLPRVTRCGSGRQSWSKFSSFQPIVMNAYPTPDAVLFVTGCMVYAILIFVLSVTFGYPVRHMPLVNSET